MEDSLYKDFVINFLAYSLQKKTMGIWLGGGGGCGCGCGGGFYLSDFISMFTHLYDGMGLKCCVIRLNFFFCLRVCVRTNAFG